jgi:chaperonin GroES
MLNLDNHIVINKETIKSPNLCGKFSDEDLTRIGSCVWDGYDRDKQSRSAWERRTEAAMELALQIQKDKTFPWPNCSNVTFPLMTVATLQFHARAYPAIINGTNIVKCRIIGDDDDGSKSAKAHRIGTHMSYQVLEEDKEWEEQHDKLLLNLAVVGTTFVKTFYNANGSHNVSEMVLARDLVLNYWSKSVEETDRKTHVYNLSRNEIHERVLRGSFRDILDAPWYSSVAPNPTLYNANIDSNHGVSMPQTDHTTPLTCLEQHCSLDLDGDGYAEPYIITIDALSKNVLRIVTRFDREEDVQRVESGSRKGQIISISPMEYFTKYGFIPSPDGSIYDIGFGTLTGPLNESVNSLVNQLLDAGTMANGGGGFLGRGAKIRGGAYTFAPFEWKRVDSTGDDLHKSIVPLQVREPSGVLLQLLSLLINYTNRISGSTDIMAGENPGQNTPAETSRTMVEQGAKIYNAIFKRIWRSMKEEFKKLYILNSIYLPSKTTFGHSGQVAMREDYLGDPSSVLPVADPAITSDEMRMRQAMALKQASMSTPGYNREEIEKRFLHALNVEGISLVYPGPTKVPPLPNPKMQVEEIKAKVHEMRMKSDMLMFMTKLEEERRLNTAKILELHAKASKEIEEAGAEKAGSDLAHMEGVLKVLIAHDESLGRQMKLAQDGMKNGQNDNGAGVSRMGGASGNEGAEGGSGGMEGGM